MSTAPAVSTVSAEAIRSKVEAASAILAKRLLPAKLDSSSKKNGHVMNSWFIRQGTSVVTLSSEAIAQELYRAIQDDVQSQFPQLVWEIPPKALTREQGKAPQSRIDVREASEFESRVRAGEKADEQRRIQEQAKKRVTELVDRFAPINHRRGTLNYDLRDTQQAAWRKQIAEAKDFVRLERSIADEQRKIYEKLERAAERI